MNQEFRSQYLALLDNAKFAGEHKSDWATVCANAGDISSSYIQAFIDFYEELYISYGKSVSDYSVIFYQNNKPCAVWAAHLVGQKESGFDLQSVDSPLASPIFLANMADKTKKDISKQCLNAAGFLAKEFTSGQFKTTELMRTHTLSHWQRQLNDSAVSNSAAFELYVNLKPPLEEIRSSLRKSHKWRVNEAGKSWKTSIQYGEGAAEFDEFQALHREVAGRETRSRRSWDIQKEALLHKHAFLVSLRSDDGRYIGGGYFMLSKTEARYGVAAYDRTLFDKPLGHLVVWDAIKYAQSLGLLWLYLGPQLSKSLTPTLTDKELSIGEFKEGFANDALVRVNSTVSVQET